MALIDFQQSVPVTLIIMLGVVVFGRSIPVLMCLSVLQNGNTMRNLPEVRY